VLIAGYGSVDQSVPGLGADEDEDEEPLAEANATQPPAGYAGELEAEAGLRAPSDWPRVGAHHRTTARTIRAMFPANVSKARGAGIRQPHVLRRGRSAACCQFVLPGAYPGDEVTRF
jgi:hypothetical protein